MEEINFYFYMRVSTDKQDLGRQKDALLAWKRDNGINIPSNNIYLDYYTGKTFKREGYQRLKSKFKKNDYLIVKEVDRLGRNWDGIKKEWQELKDNGINIIIIDTPILSDSLPSEKTIIEGLDLRLIKEQILSLMCYSAQKEREKISQRTKEGLAHVKNKGIVLGRPKSKNHNIDNFIKTIELMINNNIGQEKSCIKTGYPTTSFKAKLKYYYDKYNTKDYKTILDRLKESNIVC